MIYQSKPKHFAIHILSYFHSLFGKTAGAVSTVSELKRLSNFVFATKTRSCLSFLHSVHSLFEVSKANSSRSNFDKDSLPVMAAARARHHGLLHVALPDRVLPGTSVGSPCKKACVSANKLPMRNSDFVHD